MIKSELASEGRREGRKGCVSPAARTKLQAGRRINDLNSHKAGMQIGSLWYINTQPHT